VAEALSINQSLLVLHIRDWYTLIEQSAISLFFISYSDREVVMYQYS